MPPDRPPATTEQLAAYLHKHPGTLRNWRSEGKGPKYIKVGEHGVVYDWRDVEAWLKSQRVDPAAMA